MINPTTPITNMPMAEIFAMLLNSSELGFFNTCQTLFDCKMNDLTLVMALGFSVPVLPVLGELKLGFGVCIGISIILLRIMSF